MYLKVTRTEPNDDDRCTVCAAEHRGDGGDDETSLPPTEIEFCSSVGHEAGEASMPLHDEEVETDVATLQAKVDALRAALQPFANLIEQPYEADPDIKHKITCEATDVQAACEVLTATQN